MPSLSSFAVVKHMKVELPESQVLKLMVGKSHTTCYISLIGELNLLIFLYAYLATRVIEFWLFLFMHTANCIFLGHV